MAESDDNGELKSRGGEGAPESSSGASNKSAYANPAYVNKRLRSASSGAAQRPGVDPRFPQGFPPPPPPFGMYPPPPPPPFGMYPPPPAPRQEIEYDENGNPIIVEYVYEEQDEAGGAPEDAQEDAQEGLEAAEDAPPNLPFGAVPPPLVPGFDTPPPIEQEVKGKSSPIDDQTILELQKKGFETAQQQARENASQQRFRLVLGLFLIVLLLSALTFGVYKFFDVFNPQRSLATYEVVEQKTSASWSLPECKANDIVKAYYDSIGGVDKAGRVTNKVLSGSLHAGINVESFYCIVRGARAYLKFNNPVYPKIYLLNSAGIAKQLETASATGPSTPVSESITLQLNGIIFFDGLLHRAAFVDYAVNKQPYIYDGSQSVGDDVCDVVTMRPESNVKVSYFFSRKTKRIVQTEIDFAGFKSRVEYADYAEFGGGIFYPKSKTIYVNNTLFGNVVIDSVRFNQDALFPR